MAFAPLTALSPRAKELNDAVKKRISDNMEHYPPGLKAQYDIMLRRLDEGTPSCQMISFPGGIEPSQPGKKVGIYDVAPLLFAFL
jgi:hypothetical protein